MDLTFDDKLDVLYKKWNTLGWFVGGDEIYPDEIDLEELIAETTHAARHDGRLLKWLLTWFRDFGDLVNKKRMMRALKFADTAVLGAVLEIAVENGADANYTTVIRKCRPLKVPEVLLKGMDNIDIFIEEQKKFGKKQFRKWGLYCTTLEFYEDAVRPRQWVLERNELLAIRAIFGVNMRSEMIYALHKHGGLAIRRLSKIVEYAYSGIYREVESLIKNGLLFEEKGEGRIIRMSDKLESIVNIAFKK